MEKKKRMLCFSTFFLLLLFSCMTGCGYGRNPEFREFRGLTDWVRGKAHIWENPAGKKEDFEMILNVGGRKLILRGEDFSGTLTLSVE